MNREVMSAKDTDDSPHGRVEDRFASISRQLENLKTDVAQISQQVAIAGYEIKRLDRQFNSVLLTSNERLQDQTEMDRRSLINNKRVMDKTIAKINNVILLSNQLVDTTTKHFAESYYIGLIHFLAMELNDQKRPLDDTTGGRTGSLIRSTSFLYESIGIYKDQASPRSTSQKQLVENGRIKKIIALNPAARELFTEDSLDQMCTFDTRECHSAAQHFNSMEILDFLLKVQRNGLNHNSQAGFHESQRRGDRMKILLAVLGPVRSTHELCQLIMSSLNGSSMQEEYAQDQLPKEVDEH
ncbi:uncharacterized protein IL334_007641 [Kwoniella shivajii]|uniref:Uncharacterized protein n=1 Tax=Kwoniella shivajii TaxID=564305 RepID=A0ABZ1D984_9TREE|nr:hypothetical protein IL334_007641 [Kwoniella shivajii]